jgi:ribulose-phosphate 3-epimerase
MSNIEVSPSILSADFGYLMRDIEKVSPVCNRLHLDVMDGQYVNNISFGLPVIRSIRMHTNKILDTHLMVSDPEKYLQDFADAGSDSIIFHIECTEDPIRLLRKIMSYGKKAGISIHPDTPIEAIEPFVSESDIVLVMTVRPGFGGQKYLPDASKRISVARQLIDNCSSSAILAVDGGINTSTVQSAVQAGAKVLVCGSSVFDNPNPEIAIRELLKCATV